MTSIEWTERTWNPIVGCSVTSPGCTNCYAMTMAARIERMGTAPHYAGLTTPSRGGPVFNGKIAVAPDSIFLAPLRWKKGRMIFVNSMGDLFHENVPDDVIDRAFAVMALTPQHTYQVLTKRSARMREYMNVSRDTAIERMRAQAIQSDAMLAHARRTKAKERRTGNYAWLEWPLPNVWLGVSAEDQTRADERIPDLLATSAAIRFVSAEPLLGPVSLRWLKAFPENAPFIASSPTGSTNEYDGLRRLDWIIVGGESGHGARPMHLPSARAIKDQCAAAGVACFVKQMGRSAWMDRHDAVQPVGLGAGWDWDEDKGLGLVQFRNRKGADQMEWPTDMRVQEMPHA